MQQLGQTCELVEFIDKERKAFPEREEFLMELKSHVLLTVRWDILWYMGQECILWASPEGIHKTVEEFDDVKVSRQETWDTLHQLLSNDLVQGVMRTLVKRFLETRKQVDERHQQHTEAAARVRESYVKPASS